MEKDEIKKPKNGRVLGLGRVPTGQASVAGLVGSSLVPLGLLGLGGAIGAGLAIGGIALRWTCTMQADEAAEKPSSTAVFYKEVSDWASDALMLTGLGYALGVSTLGWGAALLVAYVAYVRALGHSLGLNQLPASGFTKANRLALYALIVLGLGIGMPAEYLAKGLGAILVISAVAGLTSTTAVSRALKEGVTPGSSD